MNDHISSKTNSSENSGKNSRQNTDMPEFFYSAGIYRHRVAGRIFMEAVFMAAEDTSRMQNVSRRIYGPIAERHGTTVGAVSKNIRDVRDTIMEHGGADLLAVFLPCLLPQIL
ncbi:MAG: hypothetical protein HFI65_02105 [Lachnospiraceae bacterium]|nr:hypothetical protein [Lachnospiraceae bacterium]